MGGLIGIKVQRGNRITLPKEFVETTKVQQGDIVGIRIGVTRKSFEVIHVKIQEKK